MTMYLRPAARRSRSRCLDSRHERWAKIAVSVVEVLICCLLGVLVWVVAIAGWRA